MGRRQGHARGRRERSSLARGNAADSGRSAGRARSYTDAVFGKDNASRGLRNDDPFDLYNWLLEAHANMTQEQVDKFFEQNPTVAHYKGLPLKEARVRVAREYTKWTWMRSQQDQGAKAQQATAVNGAAS
jgi:hypothetical protein